MHYAILIVLSLLLVGCDQAPPGGKPPGGKPPAVVEDNMTFAMADTTKVITRIVCIEGHKYAVTSHGGIAQVWSGDYPKPVRCE